MARSKGGKARRVEAAVEPQMPPVPNPWISFLRWFSRPWAAALVVLLVTLLISGAKGDFGAVSRNNYYAFLADAFLNGQLNLRVMPPTTLDLVLVDGKYYLYWPPLPSILMMPLVAVWGLGVSDHLFNAVLAAVNVGLVSCMLHAANRRGLAELPLERIGFLTLFFAFGTVHFILGLIGQVWHTGQLLAFTCSVLLYWVVLRFDGAVAFVLAGVAVGASLLTRTSMILVSLWPAYELLRRAWDRRWVRMAGIALVGLLPLLIAMGSLAAYNQARFGAPGETGLDYHLMHPHFREGYEKYGYWDPHYAPINLYYQWVSYPLPVRKDSFEGGSLLLMSPVFFAIFWAFRRPLGTPIVLAATALLGYMPVLFLMGTGYFQWGPRYLLDIHAPLLLLVAIGSQRWRDGWLWAAGAVSLLHYAIGVVVRV
jgi:hypothetical protein